MKTIRYAHSGSGKYETIGVRFTPKINDLADDKKMQIWHKLTDLFESNGVIGEVFLYWVMGQTCEVFGPLGIGQTDLGELQGYSLADFSNLAQGVIDCDEDEINSCVWPY